MRVLLRKSCRLFLELLCYAPFLFLFACGGIQSSSGEGADFLLIQFFCSPEDQAECNRFGINSAYQKTIYAGLTSQTAIDCRQQMLLIGGNLSSLESFLPSQTQTTTLWDGSNIWGEFFNWVDEDGEELDQLSFGRYRGCAFIDLNSNGLFEPGELYSDQEFNIGFLGLRFETWQKY